MFALLAALLGLAVVLGLVSRRRGARHVQGDRDPNPVRTSGLTIAIVRVRIPWYAPAFLVRRGFRAAVPEYEAIPTLEEKYFTLTEDGCFGGIYVWHSRDAAQAYYSEAWRRGVRERRGTEPDVTLLDVVAVIDGGIRLEGRALGQRSVSYPACATLLQWRRGASPDQALLATVAGSLDGAVRSFLVEEAAGMGLVTVWATRALAMAGVAGAALGKLGTPECNQVFEVPVLTMHRARRQD